MLVSYKDLKRLVRLFPDVVDPSSADFLSLLEAEIDMLNAFFINKEENFIIRKKSLCERMQYVMDTSGPTGSRTSMVDYDAEMGRIREDMVDLHYEMVLMEKYMNTNYKGGPFSLKSEIQG